MKRIEIIDHKSEYDKLQQMEYDELCKLLKEYGNAIWDDDYGEKTVLNQDPPIITVTIEGTVRDIKDCVAYHNIHYISESYADFLNSEDYKSMGG